MSEIKHHNSKPVHEHRFAVNVRLPWPVVAALERAAAEEGTTVTDQVEARLVETLMRDGLLTQEIAVQCCGAFAATSIMVSEQPQPPEAKMWNVEPPPWWLNMSGLLLFPLSVWKLVDIFVWAANHISIH